MMFAEKSTKTVAEVFRLSSPKGQFGIEIETEGRALPIGKITKSFEGKIDGSLRNGMEYISKVLSFEAVEPATNELREALQKIGATVQPSYRSSTHIHMNYCDKSFQDVLGMMVLWSIVEPIVFRQMEGRDGSLFCVSAHDSGELSQFIDLFCQDIACEFKRRGFQPRGKYSSLNVSRLGPSDHAALGTLEFRVFPTTLDGDRIKGWCQWLVNMERLVREQDDKSFLELVSWSEQNPLAVITAIFGELPFNTPRHMVGDLIDRGARTAYEMARVISKHMLDKGPRSKNIPTFARGELAGIGGAQMDRMILDDPIMEVAPAQPADPFRIPARRDAARAFRARRPV